MHMNRTGVNNLAYYVKKKAKNYHIIINVQKLFTDHLYKHRYGHIW